MSVGCPGGDGCLAPASAKAVLRRLRARRRGGVRPGPGPRPRLGRAGARRRRRRSGAAGDRRRRAQRLRREGRADRRARRADGPHPARRRARAAARAAPPRRSRRTASPRLARPPAVRGPWSSSRATTRSSPTASGSPSTRSPRPALATAGTGDVLSGMIAALLARGLEPFAAACAAVLAHARAGRDAAARIGAAESVIATDVIDSIPAGMRPGRRRSNNLAGMKTAAEIMDADVPRRLAGRRRAHRHRAPRQDRDGGDPGRRRRAAAWSGSSASRT